MSDEENAALLARIAELEAQLAEATINETVDAKAADQVARTGGSRATKGTAKTIDASKGKIGGEFRAQAEAPFLAERLSIFDRLKANYEARVADLPHEPITVTMPDGKAWAGEAVSWKTTPMEIAKSISNSLAKNCVVADVRYTGKRYAMAEQVTNAEEELVEKEADVAVKGELWDLNRPLEGDCELQLIKFGVRGVRHESRADCTVGLCLFVCSIDWWVPACLTVRRYLQCCLPPETTPPRGWLL